MNITTIAFTTISDTDQDYNFQLVSSARTYRSISLWRRIENQFGQELIIAGKVLEDRDVDLDHLLSEEMGSLSHRLNLTLE